MSKIQNSEVAKARVMSRDSVLGKSSQCSRCATNSVKVSGSQC